MPQGPSESLIDLVSPFINPANILDSIQLLRHFQPIPYPPADLNMNALEPVVVRPTAEQIETGTAIEVMASEEDVCAICQDEMPLGSEVRAIRACDHRFHIGCIDTWFQRDVRCPSCRHDIREPE